jgi:hypothetical protein
MLRLRRKTVASIRGKARPDEYFHLRPVVLSIKQGLMADLINASATVEINRLGRRPYSDATPVGKTTNEVKAAALATNGADRFPFNR